MDQILEGHLDPKQSLLLLDELVRLGFTDEAFTRLHHFFPAPQTVKIHRDYCIKTASFQHDGTNTLVQRRLELVLNAYRGAGFRSGSSAIWFALASAAVAEIPITRDV